MTEEQINEVVHLRHRLRAMLAVGIREVDADRLLDRMVALSRECDDTDLRFEHARWCAQLAMLDRQVRLRAS